MVVALVAAAPFLAHPWNGRVPTVALLMLGGIAVGPSGLGWMQPDPVQDRARRGGWGPSAGGATLAVVVAAALLFSVVPGQLQQSSLGPWVRSVVRAAPTTPLQLLLLLIVALMALSAALGVDILFGTVLAGLVIRC